MPYTNIDKQHEDAEARQEERELAIIIEATKRMHNATDDELDDIAAILPADLFNAMMRQFISSNVGMRMHVHEYFMKVVDKELPQ